MIGAAWIAFGISVGSVFGAPPVSIDELELFLGPASRRRRSWRR